MTVPLPALPAVHAAIDGRTSGPLLRIRTGAGMDRRSVHRYVARTVQAAGISRSIGPHTLRRTAGTVGLNEGIPLRDVQRLLRHARPETTLASERLCARLLRSLGCRDVEVSRYSDDEGLDGTGVLHVSLLSFPVFFQAERYEVDHPIQPNKIREFRGAMAQRGDKGFFITTSVVTARARDEARRGGAPST